MLTTSAIVQQITQHQNFVMTDLPQTMHWNYPKHSTIFQHTFSYQAYHKYTFHQQSKLNGTQFITTNGTLTLVIAQINYWKLTLRNFLISFAAMCVIHMALQNVFNSPRLIFFQHVLINEHHVQDVSSFSFIHTSTKYFSKIYYRFLF